MLALSIDPDDPFYLKSAKYPDIDDEMKQFCDEKGRFEFRWFKDVLLNKVASCVVDVLEQRESQGRVYSEEYKKIKKILEQRKGNWPLWQKTPNEAFQSDFGRKCDTCKEQRFFPATVCSFLFLYS